MKIEINNFPNSEFILVVHRELFTATKYFKSSGPGSYPRGSRNHRDIRG